MQQLLTTTAHRTLLGTSLAALLVMGAGGVAQAGTYTISGTYTITETMPDTTNSSGGGPRVTVGSLDLGGSAEDPAPTPSITDANTLPVGTDTTGASANFQLPALAVGNSTAPLNLALFSPDGTCQGTAGTGPTRGCSGNAASYPTETDPLSIAFTFSIPGGTGSVSDTGVFTAKYYPGFGTKTYLPCDPGGDGQGNSDCVTWGTSTGLTGSMSDSVTTTLSDGAVIKVTLNDISDWNITPTVSFQLVSGPDPVPEPASLALLGVGLLGTVAFALRRRA
jgi:hypothetical protein